MIYDFRTGENLPRHNQQLTDNQIMSLPIPPFKELFTLNPFAGILNGLKEIDDGLIEQLKVTSIVL